MNIFETWFTANSGDFAGISIERASTIFQAGVAVGSHTIDALVPSMFSYGATYKIGVSPTASGFVAVGPNYRCSGPLAHKAIFEVAKAEADYKKRSIIEIR